jgi:hypothetical protein
LLLPILDFFEIDYIVYLCIAKRRIFGRYFQGRRSHLIHLKIH